MEKYKLSMQQMAEYHLQNIDNERVLILFQSLDHL